MLKTTGSLAGVRILGKEAQKRIHGGVMEQPGTCAAESSSGGVGVFSVSRDDARAYATAHGTHWCCDHCDSALWYDID